MWFDSHCHISADDFEADRAQVIERAARCGVEGFVAIGSGYGIAHNARAVALAERDPRVFATVGVHPHEAQALDAAGRSALETLLDHPRVFAVGEDDPLVASSGAVADRAHERRRARQGSLEAVAVSPEILHRDTRHT